MDREYFIKCTYCNYLNPFKTEFVTFCDRCGKKLSDNFMEWKRLNPGKTPEDFRMEICISVNATSPAIQVPQTKSYWKISAIFLSILGILFFGYKFSDIDVKEMFLPANTPAKLLNKEWSSSMYGELGLFVAAPKKFTKTNSELPDEYNNYIEIAETYLYQPSKNFKVILNSILFKEGMKVRMEGAIAATIKKQLNLQGITNFEFKQSPLMVNDVNGILLDGSYHENGKFMRFQYAFFMERSNMWQVLISFPNVDENAQKVAKKIMDSVEINYSIKIS